MRLVIALAGLTACLEPPELPPPPDQAPADPLPTGSDPAVSRPKPPAAKPPLKPGEPALTPGDLLFLHNRGYDWTARAVTDNNLVKSFYWVAGRIYGDMRFGYDTVPVSKIEAIAETNLANVTASTCTSLSYPQPPPSAPWVPISDGAIVCVKTLAGGYAAVQQIWHYAPAQYTDRAALRIKHLVDPPPPPAPPQPTGDLTFSSSEGYDWNEGEVIHPLTTLDQIRTTFTWWPGGNLGDGRIYGDIYFNDDSGVVASRLAVSAEPDLDSMTAADCMQADKYMVSVDDGDIVCVKRAQGGYAALKMISHTSLAGGDLVDSGTIRIKILE